MTPRGGGTVKSWLGMKMAMAKRKLPMVPKNTAAEPMDLSLPIVNVPGTEEAPQYDNMYLPMRLALVHMRHRPDQTKHTQCHVP